MTHQTKIYIVVLTITFDSQKDLLFVYAFHNDAINSCTVHSICILFGFYVSESKREHQHWKAILYTEKPSVKT